MSYLLIMVQIDCILDLVGVWSTFRFARSLASHWEHDMCPGYTSCFRACYRADNMVRHDPTSAILVGC